MQRFTSNRHLSGSSPRHPGSLLSAEPDAIERLRTLDHTRWGRHRFAPAGTPPPGLPAASRSDRVLHFLARFFESGPAGRDFAPILLFGLGAGHGTADLSNHEHRITSHHLPLIARRYERARAEVLRALSLRGEVPQEPAPERRRRSPWARDPAEKEPATEQVTLQECRRLLGHCWAIHHTYLELRGQGARLTGAPEDEAFQGLRRENPNPRDQRKAFFWYELADVVFLGMQQRLMRLTLETLGEAIAQGRILWLLEVFALGLIFGEGRSHQRIRRIMSRLLPPHLIASFEALGCQIVDQVESGFREATNLETLSAAAIEREVCTLQAQWPPLETPSPQVLETACVTERQMALADAERYLEEVVAGRPEASGRNAGRGGWTPLRDGLQRFLVQFEAGEYDWADLNLWKAELRALSDRAIQAAEAETEYLHWPGDGENYRARRQRASAPGDRFYHLVAVAERIGISLSLYFSKEKYQQTQAPEWTSFKAILEEDEAAIAVEEWVSRLGPRLVAIFAGKAAEPHLPGNQHIQAVDLTVRQLVALARHQGGSLEQWGWLFCGVTDRLRELVRRLGADSSFVSEMDKLLRRGRLDEAAAHVHATCAPGEDPGDREAYVTVGVHVFEANIKVVRENLLHNCQLYWDVERLWLLLSSSSARREICEQERAICLELGVTHYFISARRHKKAGNQNRALPNVPMNPQGRSFYLTLDDDYIIGSQTLARLVPLAECHPKAAFVQLPLYQFGNSLPGISRARHADAAGMVVWGSITSLGLRDLRLFPDRFANRRTLALPFGTCTLFRLTPGRNSLEDTSGFFTDTVCEDFAQGLLAFSMKHMHHPRPPEAEWEDGILLDEIWIEGDGVELLGRIHQQTRWCEGSTRNAWTIWLPSITHHLQQRLGLRKMTEDRPPSLHQLAGGTAMVLGYGLEFISILLFMIGFPLTAIMAESAETLGHSIQFWATLWTLHMGYSYYLALHCGMSLRTFLDQQFMRFSAITGLAKGLYQSFRSPSTAWSACKDTQARVPIKTEALYVAVALLNLGGAILGYAKGMPIYLLCLVSTATALWGFQLRKTVPVTLVDRAAHLPAGMKRPLLAWLAFRREGGSPLPVQEQVRPIPGALLATVTLLTLTTLAMTARYIELQQFLPKLFHQHPVFLAWLLLSDLVQILSLSWIWLFTACGIRNQPFFGYDQLIAAGQSEDAPVWDVARAQRRAQRFRPLGAALAYLVGRPLKVARAGFLASSGAWLVIAVAALALRLVHIRVNGAFMDESYYLNAGRRLLTEGIDMEIAGVMFGSYVFPVLTALASYAGGLDGSRFLTMVFGVVSVIATGQIADRAAGHAAGIVAAVLAAILFPAIYVSNLATYDGPSIVGVAVSAALFSTAFWGQGNERMLESKRLLFLMGSGLALLFGILAKYVAVIFAPVMAVGIVVWTLARQPYGDLIFARLVAWGLPLVVGLLIYVALFLDVLEVFWHFAWSYKSLLGGTWRQLGYIYFGQGADVIGAVLLALIGLVGVGSWMRRASHSKDPAARDALEAEAMRRLGLRPVGWAMVFLVSQVAVFAAFHFGTRAHINYLKHVNYALPFLLPLSAMGALWIAESFRRWFEGHGLSLRAARGLARTVILIPFVLLALHQVDVMAGALRWWPDFRPIAAALEVGLRDGDRILTDDTCGHWYTLIRDTELDTPFYLSHHGKSGPEAAKEKIAERYYDVIMLSGGITGEGQALHEAIIGPLYVAGYRRVYALPGEAPNAGLYLAPRAMPRFQGAAFQARAEYERIQRSLVGEKPVSFFEMVGWNDTEDRRGSR